MEPKEFAEGLSMGYEKGVKWDCEGLGLSIWKDGDEECWEWRLGWPGAE